MPLLPSEILTLLEAQFHVCRELAKDQQGEESWLVATADPQSHNVVFGCSRCNAPVIDCIVRLPYRYGGPARSEWFFVDNLLKDAKLAIRSHLNSKIHYQRSGIWSDLRALRMWEKQRKLWVSTSRIACKTLMNLIPASIFTESLAEVTEVGDIDMLSQRANAAHYNSCFEFVSLLLTLLSSAKSEHDIKSSRPLYSMGSQYIAPNNIGRQLGVSFNGVAVALPSAARELWSSFEVPSSLQRDSRKRRCGCRDSRKQKQRRLKQNLTKSDRWIPDAQGELSDAIDSDGEDGVNERDWFKNA